MSGIGGEGGLALLMVVLWGPSCQSFSSLEMADPGALEEGKSFCPEMSQCSKLLDQKLFMWPWQITRRPDKQKAGVSNILETGWMTATAIRFLLIPYLIMIKWKYFISYRKKETEAGQGESWTFQGNPLPVFGLDCIMYFIEIII